VNNGVFRLERPDGGPAVFSIGGEHDLHTAPELRRRLDDLIRIGDPIVIDLTPSTFVDSSILGVLLDARRRAAEGGVTLALAQADGSVAVSRVLDVTGLRRELPIHESLEEALAAAVKSGGE
jgi:anti-sigma B factor antagonist